MSESKLGLPLLPARVRWAGAVAVAVAIFFLSVVTAPPPDPVIEPPSILPLDKWRHLLAYAAFGAALAYATVDRPWRTRHVAVAILVVVTVYGVGIEVWQAFLPDRYFDLGDAYANALGGVFTMPFVAMRDHVPVVSVGELVATVRE